MSKLYTNRIDHKNKWASFALRDSDKIKSSGLDIIEKDGQLFCSWVHLRRIGRHDLDMWPVVGINLPNKDADFFVEQDKRKYESLGYEIIPVKFYEDNYPN